MFVDSHCHLSFPELHDRIDEVLAEMARAGVERALCICTTLEEFERVHALALRHPQLWCTAGVHPDNEGVAEPDIDTLLALAARPRVVGIGETGLDYYRLAGRSLEQMQWQRDRFAVHIAAARRADLPLVVHTRNSADDTLAMLRSEGQGGVSGVFHCFTESREVAFAALDLGFHISFSGIVTFRSAQALREVATALPLDCLLIETDSPYLAPVPHRGRVNQPAWVAHVGAALAALRGVPVEDIAEATRTNFERLFRLPPSAAAQAAEGLARSTGEPVTAAGQAAVRAAA